MLTSQLRDYSLKSKRKKKRRDVYGANGTNWWKKILVWLVHLRFFKKSHVRNSAIEQLNHSAHEQLNFLCYAPLNILARRLLVPHVNYASPYCNLEFISLVQEYLGTSEEDFLPSLGPLIN